MGMLPLEKALATHVYWAVGDWPTESKRNLCDAIQAALKEARDAEREAIKAIVADHAAWGRSFGVEDICDKIIAAINARAREG